MVQTFHATGALSCTSKSDIDEGLLCSDCVCSSRASELKECATALHEYHLKASRRAPVEQKTAIFEKYSQHKYHSVAMRLSPPQELPPQLFEDSESCMDL